MDIIWTLLPIIPIGGLFFLWIAMLFHAIRRSISDRLLWVILLIFTNIIGALIYYFVVYRKVAKESDRQVFKRILIIGSIIIVAIALITSFMLPSKNSSAGLQDISFSKVIDYNLKGEIKRIEVKGDELTITKKGDKKPSLRSHKPHGTSLSDHGIDPGKVEVDVRSQD